MVCHVLLVAFGKAEAVFVPENAKITNDLSHAAASSAATTERDESQPYVIRGTMGMAARRAGVF
jgi:hypothetical protein